MNSTTTEPSRTRKSNVPLTLSAGASIGIVIGVVGFLAVNWMFGLNDSELGLTDSDNSVKRPASSSNENDETALDWIFTSDVKQSELHHVLRALKTLDQPQLMDLIEKSSTQTWTPRLYSVQEMLVELLLQNSPRETLTSLEPFPEHRRHSLLQLVFTHWSTVNFEEAISAAAELPQPDMNVAIRAVFEQRSDLSSQDYSSTAKKIDFESHFDEWEQELVIFEILDQDPSKAFETLSQDEIDDRLQIDLYRQVVEKWFQYDGWNILTLLYDAPLRDGVSKELFEMVAEQDRVAALNFISNVDESRRHRFGYWLLDGWIRHSREEAFQAVLDFPKSSFRNLMLRTIVSEWGREEPSSVLNRLLEIPRLYRGDVLTAAASQFAREDPMQALERIEAFRSVPGANVDRAAEMVIVSWADAAPENAVDWVLTNSQEGSRKRIELLNQILYFYTRIDPERAMTIAVEEIKPENSWYGLERGVIIALVHEKRLDTAMELLNKIQDELLLANTATEVGVALVEANRMDDTLSLAELVPEAQRVNYFYGIATRMRGDRTSDLLDLIEKLPSAELQTGLVELFLKHWTLDRHFNADQIETLRSYVPE
ncbi:MAG: hypothetical protein F4Z01_02450 [Gammaproteobacteria bacterium]|nr:hypothetical protein [Gammaproteobacteria bacterium]MYF38637.1 hypothetical protein [Gammaproteobacteria bacterium]